MVSSCFFLIWLHFFEGELMVHSVAEYTPGNKRVSGYRFRYQLTCPLYTGFFLGNALQLSFYTLTQKQLTCLSSCNWGPWISTLIWDMLAIFGG